MAISSPSTGLSRPRIAQEVVGGARSEGPARGAGAVYGASKGSYESVAGGGDGALVAAAALCASSRAFMLYRTMR
jgi:hypothetical protein